LLTLSLRDKDPMVTSGWEWPSLVDGDSLLTSFLTITTELDRPPLELLLVFSFWWRLVRCDNAYMKE